jgi:hypothetical protein
MMQMIENTSVPAECSGNVRYREESVATEPHPRAVTIALQNSKPRLSSRVADIPGWFGRAGTLLQSPAFIGLTPRWVYLDCRSSATGAPGLIVVLGNHYGPARRLPLVP